MTRDPPLVPSALFSILRRWISRMQIFPREKIRNLFRSKEEIVLFLFLLVSFFFRSQLNGKFRSLPTSNSSSFVLHTYSWIDNVDSRFVPSPALKFFPFRVFTFRRIPDDVREPRWPANLYVRRPLYFPIKSMKFHPRRFITTHLPSHAVRVYVLREATTVRRKNNFPSRRFREREHVPFPDKYGSLLACFRATSYTIDRNLGVQRESWNIDLSRSRSLEIGRKNKSKSFLQAHVETVAFENGL